MNNELRHPLTELTAGSILRLRDAQGLAVVVFEGQVWITLQDDPRDVVLAAGESFSVDRPGLTLVQAFRDSKLLLAETDPGTAPRSEAPTSHELHRWARTQRSVVIGDALAKGLTALHSAVAGVFTRASMTASPRPLALRTTVR
ncbi:MAG TPA: DUF2917 domain-containing protein [Burkholderiaceae bacterium]|nr:DUF2917 domain-containing protein [Burkholderiaceae bacterium]